MSQPLTTSPMAAGLSNQKLAIAGLALRARAGGRALCLPDLLDYRHDAADQTTLPIDRLFDTDLLKATLGDFGTPVARGTAGQELPPGDLFYEASATISRLGDAGDWAALAEISALIGAMRPTAALSERAAAALAWLRTEGVAIACQMRIERDWAAYCERLAGRFGKRQELYVPAERIVAKLARSFAGALDAVYVTCDERDLPEPPAAIRDHARSEHGLQLLFKSDLPTALGLGSDAGALERTMIDFQLAGGFGTFVGHSRSTFANLLALTGLNDQEPAACYLYNAIGDELVRRTDHGTAVDPWRAAGLPRPDKRETVAWQVT